MKGRDDKKIQKPCKFLHNFDKYVFFWKRKKEKKNNVKNMKT